MKKLVYFFSKELTDGKKEMKALLGGKGANLAEMSSLKIRVPPGFTISTEVCKIFEENKESLPNDVKEEIIANLEKLEKVNNKKLGDKDNLLLVSVRSGAAMSMPGMMDTVLNLGLNDVNVISFVEKTKKERFVWDSYRRFIQMFGDIVMGVKHAEFEKILHSQKEKQGVIIDQDLSVESLKIVCENYKKLIKEQTNEDFPQDPKDQLFKAICAVFRSWNNPRAVLYRKLNNIKGLIGTAVTVQTMVFGNLSDKSGTGVGFSRSPATGEKKFYGEFLVNAQGEDVVAGIRTPKKIEEMEKDFPLCYKELVEIYTKLENHYKDMQDIEFTVQDEVLYMLQCRNAKRTVHASVKCAVEMANEGLITKEEAIMRIETTQLDHFLHRQIDPAAKKNFKPIAKGINASPGAACGCIAFNNEQAVEFKKKNKKSILVRNETSPEDLIGMEAAQGILTSHGGTTSHAAVVARTMGKTCVAGCGDAKINEEKETLIFGNKTFKKGDIITLDGTEGLVYEGELPTVDPTFSGDFGTLMEWEKDFRKIGVRTNADQPVDVEKAIEFGADGVGLCRTEHMFFEKTRIKYIREMICAKDEEGRQKALDKIKPFQKQDFIEMFKKMNGKPICIRLLDPPLHEFLPKEVEDVEEIAKEINVNVEELKSKIFSLHESNPMLGHRGCRLGITYPSITIMQAEAILEACYEVQFNQNIICKCEIMIPLIVSKKEFLHQKKLIVEASKKIFKEKKFEFMIGTMIETPRAAIMSGDIATEAEFFSFGTNDLTQMTFGFSRDDSGPFINDYLELDILPVSPFSVIDEEGVGFLIKKSVNDGRISRPNLKCGICGEHGGNPQSVEFCHKSGLNYVSCSPYRVPIARLAAAQAAIKEKLLKKN